jgi:hypothetical protein
MQSAWKREPMIPIFTFDKNYSSNPIIAAASDGRRVKLDVPATRASKRGDGELLLGVHFDPADPAPSFRIAPGPRRLNYV